MNAVRFTTSELTELESKIRGAQDKALAMELKIFEDKNITSLFSANGKDYFLTKDKKRKHRIKRER